MGRLTGAEGVCGTERTGVIMVDGVQAQCWRLEVLDGTDELY